MHPNQHTPTTTVDLQGSLPFPEPSAVLSLRDCVVYRAVDDDEQPILIVTDGVTTISLECGLRGLAPEIIGSAERLAAAVADYSMSVRSAWSAPARSTAARAER